MKILMLGWEYPPHISGGLATACQGLVESLLKKGHEVLFLLPKAVKEMQSERFRLISASNVELPKKQDSITYPQLRKLIPNVDPTQIHNLSGDKYNFSGAYGPNLIEEVYWLGVVVSKLAKELEFDIIHAHDWLTFPAGIIAKEISRKPLLVHVHATAFDRSAKINREIYEIERQGMLVADKVMAVSNLTKKIIIDKYHIDAKKVITTYNGVKQKDISQNLDTSRFKEKIVTFLGRITYQKGPEYFIEAAEKVLKRDRNVRFVMAGKGDLMAEMIKIVAVKRLSSHFHFTGFLKGHEVDRMLAMTDVFVMPSISEPFGIAPLEAIQANIPVIISRQSGVAEVLPHAFIVDYWDTDSLSEAIYGLINHKSFAKMVKGLNRVTLQNLTWGHAAETVSSTYQSVA
ncbi:glycosyltransferase family 4 protein [uncultured Maribacter sp.]|uniref:glycosyltransferase family 4 protein n=1 Tax=uncultured Maribacter sp. TaxID=431308 RepID=UPI0030D98631